MATKGTKASTAIETKSSRKYEYWQAPDVTSAKAKWESENTTIFLEACVAQLNIGNKSLLYPFHLGWDGILKSFYNTTGFYYEQGQMKNRWEILKKHYTAWMILKNRANRCTDMGWDKKHHTFTAPPFWWETMISKNKLCSNFKDNRIENESLLAQIFYGKFGTGAKQWTSSEDVVVIDANEEVDDEPKDDSPENIVPDIGVTNENNDNSSPGDRVRKRSDLGGFSGSRKKRQSPTVVLVKSLDCIVANVEAPDSEITVRYYADTIKPTIANCVDKLHDLKEIIPGSDLHLFSSDLFETPSTRELFMGLKTDAIRVAWLQT